MTDGTDAATPKTVETPDTISTLKKSFIGLSMPIFPLYTVFDGKCTCGDPECEKKRNQGKHPRVEWTKERTTNTGKIHEWIERYGACNWGGATGKLSGVFVVDIDPRHGGDKTFNDLEMQYGKIPDTRIHKTGGGGVHIIFSIPRGVTIKSGSNVLGPGVDIKGEDGFIVLPPSRHISGGQYEILNDVPPVLPPDWLIKLLQNGSGETSGNVALGFKMPDTLCEGERNATFFSAARSMAMKGLSKEATFAALCKENQTRCQPPLNEIEVRNIVDSAFSERYEKGTLVDKKKPVDNKDLRTLTDVVKVANTHLQLSLADIEPENFIIKFIRYAQGKSDAYMEYHFATAITLLSIAADRVPYVSMTHGVIYLNTWIMCLGLSGISRKTTALKESKYLAKEIRINPPLPDAFSTERLIGNLSQHPKNYMVKDECAQILTGINNKGYNSDLRDFLCAIYECDDFRKELQPRGKRTEPEVAEIKDPYVVLQWATTPENFQKNVTVLDVTSGWLLRFLYVLPLYEKVNKDVEQCDNPRAKEYEAVFSHLKQIDLACVKARAIYMKFTPTGMKLFQEWQRECENRQIKNNLSNEASLYSRLYPYAFKMAALYALGSADFLEKAKEFKPYEENAQVKRYNIFMVDDRYVEEAIRNISEYFLPVAKSIVTAIETRENENIQAKILALLRQAGGAAPVRAIMRALHIKKKEYDEHIAALIESEEVASERMQTDEGIRECLVLI